MKKNDSADDVHFQVQVSEHKGKMKKANIACLFVVLTSYTELMKLVDDLTYISDLHLMSSQIISIHSRVTTVLIRKAEVTSPSQAFEINQSKLKKVNPYSSFIHYYTNKKNYSSTVYIRVAYLI